MYCIKCYANLPEHFKYCPVCGSKTNINSCDNCGQGLSLESNYCNYCGYEKTLNNKQLIWSGSNNQENDLKCSILAVGSEYHYYYNPSNKLDIKALFNKDYKNEGDFVDREYLRQECLKNYFPDPYIINYTITSLNCRDNNLIYSVQTEFGDDYSINEKYDKIYKHKINKMSDYKVIISDLPPIDKVFIIGNTIYVIPLEIDIIFSKKSVLVYIMSDDFENVISSESHYSLENIINVTNAGIVVKKVDNENIFLIDLQGIMNELVNFININKIINNDEFLSVFKGIIDEYLEEPNTEYKLLLDYCLEIDFEKEQLWLQNDGGVVRVSLDGNHYNQVIKRPNYAFINKTSHIIKIKTISRVLSRDRYISIGYCGDEMSFGLIISDEDEGYIFMPVPVSIYFLIYIYQKIN